MTIKYDEFVDFLKSKGLKPKTIYEYSYYAKKFLIYSGYNQTTVNDFLEKDEFNNLIARGFLLNYGKFVKSHKKEIGLNDDEITEALAVELPKLSGVKKVRLPKALTLEEIDLIESVLPTEKFKLMLKLCFYCGLRVGELIKIRGLDFNWKEWSKKCKENPTKKIMGEVRVYGKGDKEGIALVPPNIMKRVAKFIKTDAKMQSLNDYVFINIENSTKNFNVSRKEEIFRTALLEAGFKVGITKRDGLGNIIKGTSVHPHRLRHSYAILLMKQHGLNIRYIQEALRHSKISSTEIYTLINKEELKEKLEGIEDY